MPAPAVVPSLPSNPVLPPLLRTLAEATLRDRRATPDHLLVLADACDEVILAGAIDFLELEAVRELVNELRIRSPDYAA